MGLLRRGRPLHKIEVSALPFEQCPAKTWNTLDGKIELGRTVFNHCQIVGEIAKKLISHFPETLRSQLFPVGCELAAASHDIGKVSPTFVIKIRSACGIDCQAVPELASYVSLQEKNWGGHAGVSQATAEDLNAPKYVPEILGQHHGFSPQIGEKIGNDEPFGGQAWFEERQKLVDALKAALNADWPRFEHWEQARVVAGLTSVADWIGSGEFFENPNVDWQPNIEAALNDAGFITPEIIPELSFAEIFAQPGQTMEPRTAQKLFLQQVSGPGVYILEAQMGMGKTEAALYAAYQLLQTQQATGIYFALPTQLTSNKIYDRFNQFLDRIVGPNTTNRALLLHSGAWLLDQEMGEEGRPGGAWFNQGKRGLLAPFAVGTIDQALMAVMNVKHGFVRAFGLAGKVVILDEVHSYDLYTGTILDSLVALLHNIGCTVIILSATLSQSRRKTLLRQPVSNNAYPLISAVTQSSASLTETPVEEVNKAPITVHRTDNADDLIKLALERAAGGEQVLWIENTVKDAQQRYLDLAAQARANGCDIGLLHSRFTPQDRQNNEAIWVNLFGKEGWSERLHQGRILVGTQVLEQSLDIDADLLICRFAPSDMLLQRIGRLWRHTDAPRPATAKPECWLLAPNLEAGLATPTTEKGFGDSGWVYSPYILCRSLEVWQDVSRVTLPADIRGLIDWTYEEREESGQWRALKDQLSKGTRYRTGEETLQNLARLTLSRNGITQPESKAETRYSDTDTHDVLLLKSIRIDSANKSTRLTLLDDQSLILPHQKHQLSKSEWRKLAVALHQQLVRIKPIDCPPEVQLSELEKLGFGNVFYLGQPEHNEAILRVALVNDSQELTSLDGQTIGNKEYRTDLGYRVLTPAD
ncbi:CRISPR-associated helicase Cas3' [Shewanella sp.]|uniref:CRISPR-associated helicase Cas3' n=1 Tax=Shewanella sp. TaxID=50422 RepID=UPI003D13F0B6